MGTEEDVKYGLMLREVHLPFDFGPFTRKEQKNHGGKEERRDNLDGDTKNPASWTSLTRRTGSGCESISLRRSGQMWLIYLLMK